MGVTVLKKILLCGALGLATCIAVEIVAYALYAVAYGKLYHAGALVSGVAVQEESFPHYRKHPYVGYTRDVQLDASNAYPAHRQSEDTIVIGLFGGTPARVIRDALAESVAQYQHRAGFKKAPVVVVLALNFRRQPQQLMAALNRLVLGGGFDIVVNLDGLDDAWWPLDGQYHGFPDFQKAWNSVAIAEPLGVVAALREQHDDLAQLAEAGWLRHSAAFGLALRNRLDALEGRLVESTEALAEARARYDLERNGPHEIGPARTQQIRAPRLWYRSSVMLAGVVRAAGADYYHFLHPNRDSVSAPRPGEEGAPIRDHPYTIMHPTLVAWGGELRRAGIAFFDLSPVLVSHPERLFRKDDDCCELTRRGWRFLSDQIVSRIAPSLDEISRIDDAAPRAALNPGYADETLLLDGYDYDLLLRQGKRLVYRRNGCSTADRATFFLHVVPLREDHLEGVAAEHGFENLDFTSLPVRVGDRCVLERLLPDFPIAQIRTGEYDEAAQKAGWTATVDFRALGASLPFKVFRRGARAIVYKRLDCTANDMEKPFFLHVLPAPGALEGDAWPTTRDGYVKLDFSYPRGDIDRVLPNDGACVFEREVPTFLRLRTGQYDAESSAPYWQRDIRHA